MTAEPPAAHVGTSDGLRIGLFGILGSGNWGNDASLDVVVEFLRTRFTGAHLNFMVMGAGNIAERYDAPATHLQWYEAHMQRLRWVPPILLKMTGRLLDPIRTLIWVRRLDVAILPGAGAFETTSPKEPWGWPLSILALAIAARLCGVRLAFLCVGANVPGNRLIRREFLWTARLAHYRSYRDEVSREAMGEIGVDVAADRVYADLFFVSDPAPTAPIDDRGVGVGVMNYVGSTDDHYRAAQLHDQYVGAMQRLVDLLVEQGWRVRVFTGDQEDEKVARQLCEATRTRAPWGPGSVIREQVTSMEELMTVLAGVRLVVASRYHNVVGGVRVNAPTVSVSYAAKSDDLMARMGLGEFCQPASAVDVDQLVAQLHSLDRRHDELVDELAARNRDMTALAERQLEDFADFLRRP